MAKIVLGMASSHAPQLEMPPEHWKAYGDGSRSQAEHWFQGKTYSFPELVDIRAEEHLEKECTEEKFKARFQACQKAIAQLRQTLSDVAPDVCVILGDDQRESFHDDNMPAFAIYHGPSVEDAPMSSGHRAKYSDPVIANGPAQRLTHPTESSFGYFLVKTMIENEFDVARSNQLPSGRREGAIGHAFYYVYRRLMDNKVIPNVPVMVNTYYPPNAPIAKRCFKFGQALRQAIEAWDSSKRVAVIASGGLSHTVIEEDLDQRIIEGLRHGNADILVDYPDVRFRAGTSEIKNWIALGGVMAGSGLEMNLVDYVPCYRTEAGNGCAMGFAEWR